MDDRALLAAVLSPSVVLIVFLGTQWLFGRRERQARHRERFAQAFEAVVEYAEFPYVVRRRRASVPEDERIRISTEMRQTQERLGFHLAWLTTESKHVALAYGRLVGEARSKAGGAVHDAWLQTPIATDAAMNIPDVGPRLEALEPRKDSYLEEVVDHLSVWPRWCRRSFRRCGHAARWFLSRIAGVFRRDAATGDGDPQA